MMPEPPTYPPHITYHAHPYTAALPYSWVRIGPGGWVPVQVVGGDALLPLLRRPAPVKKLVRR